MVRLLDDRAAPRRRHAHRLMVARLAERRAEAGQDPLHEVYDFANWAAEQAPADLSARDAARRRARRALSRAGRRRAAARPDPAASGHWVGRGAHQVMKAASTGGWWIRGPPHRHLGLNFLAHAKFCEGRAPRPPPCSTASARTHPGAVACPDRDPYQAFRAARDSALGTV